MAAAIFLDGHIKTCTLRKAEMLLTTLNNFF